MTALNYADVTYRLFGYFSRAVFVGPAAPGTLRLVGAGIAIIGTVGLTFAASGLDHLVRVMKRKLKKIQDPPHPIDGCLAGTGLRRGPP